MTPNYPLPEVRKVATWDALEVIRVAESSMPSLKKGEMLIKVMACSICGSDIRIFKNGNPRVKSGQIVGHEIAGRVVAVNEVANFSVGDDVSVGADVPCGDCRFCNAGNCNCCRTNLAIGHQLEGGFTEYVKLQASTVSFGPVQKFVSPISYAEAALAEPLACCINGYEKCGDERFDSVLIFGAGPIGMLLGFLGKHYGAKTVIMIDPSDQRLSWAEKLKAADYTIKFDRTTTVEQVMSLTNGFGCDRVFTACPVSETHSLAIELVSVMGVVNLFGGLPASEKSVPLPSNEIHYKEAKITGSHGSTPKQHKKALKLIESGSIKVSQLITHEFSLDGINEAYACAMSGTGLKVVIKPHTENIVNVS